MPTVSGATASELLSTLSLGDGAAENEPALERHFLRTSAFHRVVEDKADLVRGVKGSGKSAIFRFLQTQSASPHLADVLIIPAFDFVDDDLFQLIVREWSTASEDTLRRRWRVYVLALIGNALLNKFNGDERLDEVETYLVLMGLRSKERRFAWLMNMFKAAPVDWAGPMATDAPDHVADDIRDLTSAIREALGSLKRRVWVVFDRLDEAFYTDPIAERLALRALVQVTRDLNALGEGRREIRLKLFLRDDILVRMARGGPQTNLTHVRKLRLTWNPDSLSELIVRRIVSNEALLRAFRLDGSSISSRDGRTRVLAALLPQRTPTELASCDHRLTRLTWPWIMLYLRDGTNTVNPRNLIEFFDLACGEQQDIWARNDPPQRVDSLLGGRALYRAWVKLSNTRLEDTILLEHAGLEPHIGRLRGGRVRYTRGELDVRLECGPTASAFEEACHLLTSAGALRDMQNGTYEVPLLYRPALTLSSSLRPDA